MRHLRHVLLDDEGFVGLALSVAAVVIGSATFWFVGSPDSLIKVITLFIAVAVSLALFGLGVGMVLDADANHRRTMYINQPLRRRENR